MKVLIAGAPWFLGKNQILHCQDHWDMTGIYCRDVGFPDWLKQNGLNEVKTIQCDLTNVQDVKSKLKGSYDVLIHFAANGDPAYAIDHPIRDPQKSTPATKNLMNHTSFHRIVYTSSGAVYEGCKGLIRPSTVLNPKLRYALSHLESEAYVLEKAQDREAVIARLFGVYGPYEPEEKIFSQMVQTFAIEKKNSFSIYGNGKNFVDAMYVGDISEIIRKIVEKAIVSPIIDVGTGNPYSITELVKWSSLAFGVKGLKINYQSTKPEHTSVGS
jgi:nucleoside-diphosphate-sugar epimerase